MAKKIILFIVEGISDQTCLGYILSKILNNHRVEFQMTQGDITTKIGINSSNVSAKIGDVVKEFSGKIFKARDFCEIVHLIDMDGAYVSDDKLIQKRPDTPVDLSDQKRLYYSDNQIFVNNIEDTQRRNQLKTSIINRLITLKRVWKTIPYSAYFFSCNLDHIMHEQRNLLSKDKITYAEAFISKYEKDETIYQFIDLMHDPGIAVKGDYEETWTFIKADTNSLKRYTNFHLFFSNPKNPRE